MNRLVFSLLLLWSCSTINEYQGVRGGSRGPSSVKNQCTQALNDLANLNIKSISDNAISDYRFYEHYIGSKNYSEMESRFWSEYNANLYLPRTLSPGKDLIKAKVISNGDFPDSATFTLFRAWNNNPKVPQFYNKPTKRSGHVDTVTTISHISNESIVFTEEEKAAIAVGDEWIKHMVGISDDDFQRRLKESRVVTETELGHKRRITAHLKEGFINTLILKESKKYKNQSFPQTIPIPRLVNGEVKYKDTDFPQKSDYTSLLTDKKYNNKRTLPQRGLMRLFKSSRVSKELLEYAFYYRRIELIERAMRNAYKEGKLNSKQKEFYRRVVKFLNEPEYRPTKRMMRIVRVDEAWSEAIAFFKVWQKKRIVYEARFSILGPYEKATEWTKFQVFARSFLFWGTFSGLVLNTLSTNSYYEYFTSIVSETSHKILEMMGVMTDELSACAKGSDRPFHIESVSTVHNYISSISGSVYDKTRIDPTLDPENDNKGEYDIARVYMGQRCFDIREQFKNAKAFRETQKDIKIMAAFHSHMTLFKFVREERGQKVAEALRHYLEQKEIRKNERTSAVIYEHLKKLTDEKFMKELATYRKHVQETVQALILDGSFRSDAIHIEGYLKDIENAKK